jgi:hypothetical protein
LNITDDNLLLFAEVAFMNILLPPTSHAKLIHKTDDQIMKSTEGVDKVKLSLLSLARSNKLSHNTEKINQASIIFPTASNFQKAICGDETTT